MLKPGRFMDGAANEGNSDGEIDMAEWMYGWNRLAKGWSTEELQEKLLQVRWMREAARLRRVLILFESLDEEKTVRVPRGVLTTKLKSDDKLKLLATDMLFKGSKSQMLTWSEVEAVVKPQPLASLFGPDLDRSGEGLRKAFAEVDADSSGKISGAEMKAYIQRVYGSVLEDSAVEGMLQSADKDDDGEVRTSMNCNCMHSI